MFNKIISYLKIRTTRHTVALIPANNGMLVKINDEEIFIKWPDIVEIVAYKNDKTTTEVRLLFGMVDVTGIEPATLNMPC